MANKKRYHVVKQTRLYNGEGYQGYSSNGVLLEFDSLYEAEYVAEQMQRNNPVGWNVFDSRTGKCVKGLDIFQESK